MVALKRYLWGIFFTLILLIIIGGYNYSWGVRYYLWEEYNHPIPMQLFTKKDQALVAQQHGNFFGNYGNRVGSYDLARSNTYYTTALRIDPHLPGTHFFLGLNQFITANFFSAQKFFDQELRMADKGDLLHPYYSRALYMRSLTYGFMNKLEESAKGFSHLIKEYADDERSWAYYTDLAWVYFQQGKFEEIKQIMEGENGGYARYPDNPWVLNMYALALHNLDDSDRAHTLFLKADKGLSTMTPQDWMRAYPGNDPGEAAIGLADLREVVKKNIELTEPSS